MNITDIRKANKGAGFHFFLPATMRFFGSIVYPEVYGDGYFVTSELDLEGTSRRWTVRKANPDGSISTVGEFQAYDSLGAAVAAAKREARNV